MSIQLTDLSERLPSGWQPKSPAQKMALACPSEVLCYGGSVGSLKSETILVDALKYYQNPKYRGIIFRKTYPEVGFLIDRTRELYSNTGGTFYEGPRQWRWPWGAIIEFRHLDSPKDVYKYQGFEFQYVAFDESTHQPEFPVRYILQSRMRSVENIPLRMRLPTNPGNIGAGWHKFVFHGKRCIHCVLKTHVDGMKWPSDTREYGKIYHDVRWQSDKVLMNHSTCYIPGKVTDHTLFGQGGGEYMKKLQGLPVALQEALLQGCWEAFEGQYFDCFDINTHVIERSNIDEKSWWPYWVGIDYGFKHACVAYLFTKSPQGVVYVLDEYVVHGRKGVDAALDINKLWDGQRVKVQYLSPDTFSHDGKTDFSQAEMMAQATGVFYERAYNDRISGWLLCYQLLQNKKMFITQNCPLLIEAIQMRVHDEKNDGDIEKQTDDGDDAVDAWRYGVASEINPGERPESEILEEKIKNEWSTDPTVAMIQYQMYSAGKAKADAPIAYRQSGRGYGGSQKRGGR